MGFEVAEADRMIGNIIQIGVVTDVDASASTANVNIGKLPTDFIPVGQLRAGAISFWWMPQIGEQVLVAAPSGDMANAVIVCSFFAGNAPSSDGDVPKIELNGGKMIVAGDIEVTGDVIASGVSLVHHTHPHGDPAGNTGAPN